MGVPYAPATLVLRGERWWAGAESNRRHQDFQSCALPTELPARVLKVDGILEGLFVVAP